ncbi:MAG: Ppx/GppA family phosphatase, partial [Solirubrobacteraceae bacterium]
STQVGVVRHTERHLHDDPPAPEQLRRLRDDVAATLADHVPNDLGVSAAVAVAGTATQSSSMLGTDTLRRDDLEALLQRLAALPLEARRRVPGLDPDRAPTMVAGVAILLEALAAIGLESAEASDHDILRGVALHYTAFLVRPPQFSG